MTQHENKISTELSPQEGIVFQAFKRFKPVPVDKLYAALWPEFKNDDTGYRWRQQRVGGIISRLNKKIAFYDLKIMPGRERGTYALCRVIDRPVID